MSVTLPVSPEVVRKSKPRVETIDCVKGFAITLVVVGHTGQGIAHRGWWVTPRYFFMDHFIYSFHMAAFFFVAGLFALGSLNKRGAKLFATEKLRTLFYPYALWATMNQVTDPLTERFRTGGTPTLHWFLVHFFRGDTGWFLITLFACMMVVIATWKIPAWIRIAAAIAIACVLPSFGIILIDGTIAFFPYVAIGMGIGSLIFRLEAVPRLHSLAGAVVVFLYEGLLVHRWTAPLTRVDVLYLGITGTLGLLLVSRAVEGTWLGHTVAWIGRGSLAVFLIGEYFQGFGRELVRRALHTTAVWPQMVIPSLLALAIPALVWHLSARYRVLNWLFTWPAPKTAVPTEA